MGQEKPILHCWQTVAPTTLAKVPAGQGEHVIPPGEERNWPSTQGIHNVAPERDCTWPAGQGEQTAPDCPVDHIMPGLHDVQKLDPASETVPTGQVKQLADPGVEKELGLHRVQRAAPAADQVPPTQRWQLD